MSRIPEGMPYNEEFTFFGVKAKDMTRIELLQVICHISNDMQHYKKSAEDKANELSACYARRKSKKRFILL
jgi:hypothetical protein